MRRLRLETTPYGPVPELPESASPPPSAKWDMAADSREHRWVTRKSAFSNALVAEARGLFEERLGRSITEGEARNLLGNLADYAWMLVKCEIDPHSEMPVDQAERRRMGRPRKKRESKPPPRPRGRPRKHPLSQT